jgi:hypothetical protein
MTLAKKGQKWPQGEIFAPKIEKKETTEKTSLDYSCNSANLRLSRPILIAPFFDPFRQK